MATKPIVSFTFASDANFASGPATGFPVKIVPPAPAQGHVAGAPVVSEYVNYHTNILGGWTVWLLAGSSAAGLDAHLVETSATGTSTVAAAALGGTASGTIALVVASNTGATSAAATFTNNSTGFGAVATAIAALAGLRGVNTGTGPGLEGLALGTNNPGVKGTGAGTGPGAALTGGATGPGATCTGGASGAYGANCVGTGAFAGLYATGGPTADEAILGEASSNTQLGVHGKTTAAATTATAAIYGEGLGSADGLRATAEQGYALYAQGDSTSPQRASMRVGPQNADPVSGDQGAMTHRSDLDIGRVFMDGIWQSPWATASGLAFGLDTVRSVNVVNGDSTTYATLNTVNMVSPYEPRFAGGQVLVHASARFGDVDSANHHYFIDVQIIDSTAGAVVYADTICTGAAAPDVTVDGFAVSQWSVSVPYTLPASGSRTFLLRYKPNVTTGFDAVGNFSSMNITGVYG